MRLISIGKSSSCTVCIPNDYVSSYHAEILLLDNGDIYLTDCGSKNGTFLNGKRITPNVDVPVRRGDRIEFDTVLLNWGVIPQIPLPDPSKVKGIYGVGKNQRNRYTLSGDSVSRYHATFKEMKNGKWFIQDHSKNGTYINGNRIPSNQDVPIKASDSIVCGTVPCPNPVPAPSVPKWVWWVAGGTAAAILVVFALMHVLPPTGHDTDPYKAIVLVESTSYYKVKFADDPYGSSNSWYFASDYFTEAPIITQSPRNAYIYPAQGTAFFISDKGLLLTNKHVTNVIYADEQYDGGRRSVKLKRFVEQARAILISELYAEGKISLEAATLWDKSAFTISMEPISFGIRYPGRTYTSASEMDWAHLVKESDDPEADIAVLRLNSGETPKDRDWFDLGRSIDIKDLKLNVENYYTLGFPYGDGLATVTDNEKYEPTSCVLHISRTPGKYILYLQGDKTIEGQSGSPIYDKKHRLVGILWGGFKVTDNTNACPIVHAKKLLDDVMEYDSTNQIYKSKNAN